MKKAAITIFVFFLLLYILPLGVRPMIIPDETRYAEIGREIIETGDWVVPRLNGLRYFEKPILGHWFNALSIELLGENAFAIRLSSALSVGLSAFMLFFLVSRFTRDSMAAILAASIFLTCFEVYGIGTFCSLDSVFSMFITASMIIFFFAFMETAPLRRTIYLIGFGIMCGLAFLTKGFLAFVIPGIIIVPFTIWQHRFKEFLCVFWIPVIAAVFIALPWSIMIHLREPDFWHYFFWTEHVNRFISAKGGQHPNPFWLFIPFILGGSLPWTAQIGAAICRLRKIPLKDPLLCYAICWFLLPFIFFSACRGKLITYILPCFPPLIVLFIISLRQEFTTETAKRFNYSNVVGLILIIALAIVLILTQTVIPNTRVYRPGETWKWLFLIAGFLVYAILLIQACKATSHVRKFGFSCLAPLLLMFSVQFAIPDQFLEGKAPVEFLKRHKDKISQDTVLVSDNYLTPAVCWCYKRSDVFLLDKAGEFEYGLEYDVSSKQRLLDIDQFRKLITKGLDRRCITLITSTKRYVDYKPLLPKPIFEDVDGGFVFVEFTGRGLYEE
jgi:4-amino-4-deoxy-L-arabinose transferase